MDWRDRLARWCRSPLFWILFGAAVLRLAGIGWGLPASDGWDDDGIAPRNFLVGLAQTYTHGSYFAYPPLHMIVLAILTLPGWAIALFHAHSLSPHDVIAEITQVPYMTFFSAVARLVSAAMSLGTIYLVAKMTETVAGARAGLFAAAACALNAAFTYYSQVSNLESAYLFWSCLALLGWMRAIGEREPRHMWWAALSTAAAIATKDQAYAVFLLSMPVALGLWFALDRWPRQHAGRIAVTLLLSTGAAVLALLVIDGAIVNPIGFAHRLAFLTGHASADYAEYQNDWSGRIRLLKDMGAYVPRYYPFAAALIGAIGVFALPLRGPRSVLVAWLVPLLAAISFTVAFNFVALRGESRFLLPQSIFLAVYIGIAIDKLSRASAPWIRYGAVGLVSVIAALGLYQCLGIDAAFLGDPRYDAERWLAANVRPGDVIETYGLNAYLPRFPRDAIVTRLDLKPLKSRNPLPHVTELDQPLGSIVARHPRFVVVSAFWVRDYLSPVAVSPTDGRAMPRVMQTSIKDLAARGYFGALFGDRLPYRIAHKSSYARGFWPAASGYESLCQTIYLFERVP